MSERLFENRKEWYKHETQYHRMDWSCNTFGHPDFQNQSYFINHMSASHGAHLDEKKLITLRAMFQKPSKRRSGECNLCGASAERLETHVAHHLQQISLFALPRANDTQGSGDAEFDTQSSRVRGDKQEQSHEISWKTRSVSTSSMSEGENITRLEETQTRKEIRNQMLELLLDDEVPNIGEPLLVPLLGAINATEQFFLLDQLEAKLNSTKDFNFIALQSASMAGYVGLARFLLESERVNVNATTALGVTPLMMAAEEGQLSILQTLISKGADLNFRNESNATAIMMARRAGRESAVRLLLEYGAEIGSRDDVNNLELESELRVKKRPPPGLSIVQPTNTQSTQAHEEKPAPPSTLGKTACT